MPLTCNLPRRVRGPSTHKYEVLACVGGRRKVVRFGQRGASDYLQHHDPERRRNFRSRHRCAEKRDRFTAGWWSCNWSW